MKRRIFIAIQIPEELKNLAEVYLKPFLDNKNLRIPKKEGWHITLVFCGYLEEEKINKLKDTAEKIAQETKTFELIPDKIIFAPPQRAPRMIWLTFKQSPEFLKISKKFAEFSRETREQVPHLTLARFEEYYFSNIKNLLLQEGVDLTKEAMPFSAKEIDIMESHLSRQGAEYKLLCRNYLK